MNLISLELTFWDRQCQSNWDTLKGEEFLSSTLKGDSGIHWQTARGGGGSGSNFYGVEIHSKLHILQSMVRESSFTTGNFLLSSDQMDEGNQEKLKQQSSH